MLSLKVEKPPDGIVVIAWQIASKKDMLYDNNINNAIVKPT